MNLALTSGTRLGTYEILAPLGAGGMGEVYKAKDTRLDRTVALKVLPEEFFENKERVARFEREAKLLAALNHPNVAAIYAFEEIPGSPGFPGSLRRHVLVQEFLEGETLRDALRDGHMAPKRAVEIAAQVARGIAAAHEKDIVHRDLKPENVFLTKDGRVKVLDFGLAKLSPKETEGGILTHAGTVSLLTEAGTVFGTVSYMSPEQVRGEPVDHRSDIFSFGTMVYEMLSKKNPFRAPTTAETMTAILREDPPHLALSPGNSAALSTAIAHCLEKTPDARFQSAADLAFALENLPAPFPLSNVHPARSLRSRAARGAVAFVAGVALAGLATLLFRAGTPRAAPGRATRFTVPPPENGSFYYRAESTCFALSPDGSQLAYIATDPRQGRLVYLRPMGTLEPRPLTGTEGVTSLFWSPDGTSLGLFVPGKLKRYDLSAGAPVSICDVQGGGGKSGTWGKSGDILFASVQGDAIYRVSSSGGTPAAILKPDASRGEARVVWPSFLPDGEKFLYSTRASGGGTLMLSEPGSSPRLVMPVISRAQYVEPGYLVFAKEGTLLGQRFDAGSGRLSGRPFSIADHVRYFMSTAAAAFSASGGRTIALQPQDDVHRLVWFDRTGHELGVVGVPAKLLDVMIPRDGRPILFDRAREDLGTFDVWSYDVDRKVETRLTSAPESEFAPVWLPGGKSIAYSTVRGSNPRLVRRDLATGSEEDLLPTDGFQVAADVSPDGRTLVYFERTNQGVFDLWELSLSGGRPRRLLEGTAANAMESTARFSADGRFLAVISAESGSPEAYVLPFPGPGEKTRVSTGGASAVRWNPNRHELLYVSSDRRLMSVPVQTSPALQLGTPEPLFTLPGKESWIAFDVAPDGKRFLAVVPEVVADRLPLTVIVNWTSEVEK